MAGPDCWGNYLMESTSCNFRDKRISHFPSLFPRLITFIPDGREYIFIPLTCPSRRPPLNSVQFQPLYSRVGFEVCNDAPVHLLRQLSVSSLTSIAFHPISSNYNHQLLI